MRPCILIGRGLGAAREKIATIGLVLRRDGHVLLPEVGGLRIKAVVEQDLLCEHIPHPEDGRKEQCQQRELP